MARSDLEHVHETVNAVDGEYIGLIESIERYEIAVVEDQQGIIVAVDRVAYRHTLDVALIYEILYALVYIDVFHAGERDDPVLRGARDCDEITGFKERGCYRASVARGHRGRAAVGVFLEIFASEPAEHYDRIVGIDLGHDRVKGLLGRFGSDRR